MITKLKYFLIKHFPAVIFFIVKNYIGLDFINDFNPFSSETKEFFNGNSSEEGEVSNRQNNNDNNNNTPNQDSSISPHEEVSEEELMECPGELMEDPEELMEDSEEELMEDPELARQKIL
jgi:hypothetical protein